MLLFKINWDEKPKAAPPSFIDCHAEHGQSGILLRSQSDVGFKFKDTLLFPSVFLVATYFSGPIYVEKRDWYQNITAIENKKESLNFHYEFGSSIPKSFLLDGNYERVQNWSKDRSGLVQDFDLGFDVGSKTKEGNGNKVSCFYSGGNWLA